MLTPSDSPPADSSAPLVEVVPLGRVSGTATAVAAANLQAILGLDALVAPARPLPGHCLAPSRGQYDAGRLLLELAGEGAPPPLRLGLTASDLCLPFLTHVFGEAQLGGRAAVVSLRRLGRQEDGSRAPRDLLLERVAKVALHETAHILGLTHCRGAQCLMRFSGGLAELDRLDLAFCPACRWRLEAARRELRGVSGPARAEPAPVCP